MSNFMYDFLGLFALIAGGYLATTFLWNISEIAYWRYRDWLIRNEEERGENNES